jgi:hypothetical protein
MIYFTQPRSTKKMADVKVTQPSNTTRTLGKDIAERNSRQRSISLFQNLPHSEKTAFAIRNLN